MAHGKECYGVKTGKIAKGQITEGLKFLDEQAMNNFIGNGEPLTTEGLCKRESHDEISILRRSVQEQCGKKGRKEGEATK